MIGINDPDARLMLNKKGKWEWNYNAQIIVDEWEKPFQKDNFDYDAEIFKLQSLPFDITQITF